MRNLIYIFKQIEHNADFEKLYEEYQKIYDETSSRNDVYEHKLEKTQE